MISKIWNSKFLMNLLFIVSNFLFVCLLPVAVEVPGKIMVKITWFRLHVKIVAIWLCTQAHIGV